jgi:cytidylate kinase
MKRLLITIDGPAGAGKTTVSQLLAQRMDYRFIDTGALYRGVALAAKVRRIRPNDARGLASLCATLELGFGESDGGLRLMADGRDISDAIRTPKITMMASAISQHVVVRQYLLKTQRAIGRNKRVVFEGRDMGTVVFPDADLKFFLDAAIEIRALRRYRELPEAIGYTLKDVIKEMEQRDRQDTTRAVAPLRPAPDAIIIDSTRLSAAEVVDIMTAHVRALSMRSPPQ